MCGIAGEFNFRGEVVSDAVVKRMCDTIIQRGPDAYRSYCAPHIGLGQRRLSIIDLRDTGNPPLSNENGSVWIAFNGEIYNFRELRDELSADGHDLQTRTDTEVIVHLYEKYGTSCVDFLRGMFAFVIWDANNKRVFAARDRLGKKPLFYTRTPSSLVFGSSLNAVLAAPTISRSPNYSAIDSYLTRQYVPSPETAFEGIWKLPAAHHLVCDTSGAVQVRRYWSPEQGLAAEVEEGEIESEIVRRLREAVRMRLVADVPVGVFLSGGIDSGVVTALMAQESSERIKTFSIGFEEDQYSELPYARKVAERYDTDHYEYVVRPAAAEVLPVLVKNFGEPFADSSAVPTYYVSKMARQHVTVALSGDGGDESFLGYAHYGATAAWTRADVVPYAIRRPLASLMGKAVSRLSFSDVTTRVERATQLFGARLPERYAISTSMVKQQEKRELYTPKFRSLTTDCCVSVREDFRNHNLETSWDWMSLHDKHHYLPDCLMVKTDVAAMANSLEVRCPLLDHEFVSFAGSIPARLKRDATGGKAILKRAVRNLLPPEVLRKPKTGFGIPVARWLATDLQPMLRGALLDGTCAKRGLFDQSFLKRLVDDQVNSRRDWSNRLWGLLCLELWFREYLD